MTCTALDVSNWESILIHCGVASSVASEWSPIFSAEIDDEVSSTLYYPGGHTVSVSVNWSDESVRKMTTRITIWGTAGKIYADRRSGGRRRK